MFLSFERRSVIVFSNFLKKILSKIVQKQALIVGNNCTYSVSIVINFYYTPAFIQVLDPLKRDKQGWQVMEIGCFWSR